MGMRVGELARRTGVGVSTLRAWESRYGFLEPQRSPAGHRLYDEADVDRVEAVVRLAAEGLTLASAITRVSSTGPGALPEGEAEERFCSRVLEAAEQGIWVSRDGRTRYANRRMAEMMGYTVEELVNLPVLSFFAPEALPLVRERTALVRIGQPLDFTIELRRSDGSMFPAEITTRALMGRSGRYEGGVAVVEDITGRVEQARAQQRELRRTEAIALLGAQLLLHRPDHPEAVASFGTEVAVATRRLLDADHATVLELDPHTQELRARAASPDGPRLPVVPSGSQSMAGYVALARRVVVVRDAANDERFEARPMRAATPTRSAIGAPVLGPAGTVGVLLAESNAVNHFGDDDGHFVQGMANVLGAARLA